MISPSFLRAAFDDAYAEDVSADISAMMEPTRMIRPPLPPLPSRIACCWASIVRAATLAVCAAAAAVRVCNSVPRPPATWQQAAAIHVFSTPVSQSPSEEQAADIAATHASHALTRVVRTELSCGERAHRNPPRLLVRQHLVRVAELAVPRESTAPHCRHRDVHTPHLPRRHCEEPLDRGQIRDVCRHGKDTGCHLRQRGDGAMQGGGALGERDVCGDDGAALRRELHRDGLAHAAWCDSSDDCDFALERAEGCPLAGTGSSDGGGRGGGGGGGGGGTARGRGRSAPAPADAAPQQRMQPSSCHEEGHVLTREFRACEGVSCVPRNAKPPRTRLYLPAGPAGRAISRRSIDLPTAYADPPGADLRIACCVQPAGSSAKITAVCVK
jgi:hypothetical protein